MLLIFALAPKLNKTKLVTSQTQRHQPGTSKILVHIPFARSRAIYKTTAFAVGDKLKVWGPARPGNGVAWPTASASNRFKGAVYNNIRSEQFHVAACWYNGSKYEDVDAVL
jgi:hypothetical protein